MKNIMQYLKMRLELGLWWIGYRDRLHFQRTFGPQYLIKPMRSGHMLRRFRPRYRMGQRFLPKLAPYATSKFWEGLQPTHQDQVFMQSRAIALESLRNDAIPSSLLGPGLADVLHGIGNAAHRGKLYVILGIQIAQSIFEVAQWLQLV